MRLHRFIGNFDLGEDSFVISDKEIFNQLKNVFRFSSGDQIILGDGGQNEAIAEIKGFKNNKVEVEILKRYKNSNEPKTRITLFCSMLKKENFELVVSKATEIGVAAIVPIVTKRTVKLNLKENRLKKIISEAAEQSGRGIVPLLGEPRSFQKAISQSAGNDFNILFDPRGNNLDKSLINAKDEKRVGIMIGPEGGWDESEIIFAKENGCKIINLGKLTLRAETAALVGSCLILNT